MIFLLLVVGFGVGYDINFINSYNVFFFQVNKSTYIVVLDVVVITLNRWLDIVKLEQSKCFQIRCCVVHSYNPFIRTVKTIMQPSLLRSTSFAISATIDSK